MATGRYLQDYQDDGRYQLDGIDGTLDFFFTDTGLVAVSNPATFPIIYHLKEGDDGDLHVSRVEHVTNPDDLDVQIAYVRGLIPIDAGGELEDRCLDAMDRWVNLESPAARGTTSWDEEQSHDYVERVLAEAEMERKRKSRYDHVKPEKPPVERIKPKHDVKWFFGVTLPLNGDD